MCYKGRKSKLKHNTITLNIIVISLLCSDLREAVTRLRSAEVNAVSGVLKLYFRELPEPLIPTELFQSLNRTLGNADTPPAHNHMDLHISKARQSHWRSLNFIS